MAESRTGSWAEERIEGRGEESRLSGGVDADEKPRSTGGELVLD